MKPAVLFVGHGSRDPEGTAEFLRLVELFRARDPERIVECGFLEFARPVIGEGIEPLCRARGAEHVVVLPGMLMAAGHAKNDIPSEIHEARRRFPDVNFHYGRHLHLHAKHSSSCAGCASRRPSAPQGRPSVRTRCSWSSAAAAAIRTPTRDISSWPACSGKGWASAGRPPATSA